MEKLSFVSPLKKCLVLILLVWVTFCLFVFLFSLVIASPFGCLCYKAEPLGKTFKKQTLMVDTFVLLTLETYRH